MFRRLQKLLLTTTALVPLGLAPAVANPLGGQVVGGSATVQGQGTATVTVTQQTNSAIINWNTFNIGAGEKTNIAMPSASSVQLDRVTGGLGPSQIFGSLWSNGRVFLVNPDGILFGSGAKVDTAGFLATTHDIANSDFMAGRYNFSIPGKPTASIVNQGTITAQTGGFAALVAPGVRNSGTITATLGTVALASGNSFTLDFYGDKLITLGLNDSIAATVKDVATGQSLDTLVKNEGTLKANGGRVELTAASARQVVDSVINTTGVIEANTIGTHNGMIVLGAATAATKPVGAPTQTVKVSGILSAAGKKKGTTGGTVVVTAENIAISGATIDASGKAGGGTVLIGGDVGGGNPNSAVAFTPQAQLQPYAVPTASTTAVDAATTINASATDTGNGGKVVVWADQSTLFDGSISVRGGATFGNGGFVETSGHQSLSFNGTVDLSAAQGAKGTLLLDPQDVTIASTGAWIVTPSALETALASGDVIVTTGSGSGNGDITVAESVSWANASALTLNAYRNIAVNANITNAGGAAVKLRADDTDTGVGTVSFASGVQVSTAGVVSIFYNPSVNPGGGLVNNTSYANPTENFTGNVTGGGSLTAYMLVNTVYDLQNIQNNLSGTYALGKDIDASATAGWNGGAGLIPIGNWSAAGFNPFYGIFDGQGFAINNLSINVTTNNFNPYGVGLFGLSSGTLNNVALTNVSVFGNSGNIGPLVGFNKGTVNNSYSTGSVSGGGAVGGLVGLNYTGGQILGSYSSASVSAINSSGVGGLVGTNEGTIAQSYAIGAVTGGGTWNGGGDSGGLAGSNNGGTIVQSYAAGIVRGSGLDSVGGLTGFNSGTISNSYSTGSVNGDFWVGGLVAYNYSGAGPGLITQSYATGNVSGGSNTGGLVGVNAGTINQSYATGAVESSQSSNVGGLVGWNPSESVYGNGVITQSYATGTVTAGAFSSAGGLVGLVGRDYFCNAAYTCAANIASVDQSYATGAVTAGLNSTTGGLVGFNGGGTITNSYWDTYTTGQQYAYGNQTSVGATAVTSGPNQSNAANYAFKQSAYGNFDFTNTWFMIDGQTRPFLQSEWSTTITNAHQLQLVSMNLGASYTLANYIDLGPALAADSNGNYPGMWGPAGFVPIGNYSQFNGLFDGLGRTIENLTINQVNPITLNTGLFGYIGQNGVVQNVSITNASIDVPIAEAGILAGQSDGNVINVRVSGSITSNGYLGGLIGFTTASSKVSQSFADVSLANTASSGSPGGGNNGGCTYCGGLVGLNEGIITSSYATGSINSNGGLLGGLVGYNYYGGSIDRSYATGNVTSSGFDIAIAGGLAGVNAGQVSNSYALGLVTAQAVFNNLSLLGGFVGQNVGTIVKSYAIGSAILGAPPTSPCIGTCGYVGGFVGDNSAVSFYPGTIEQSYATGSAAGAFPSITGAFEARNFNGTIANSAATTEAFLKAGIPSGFDPTVWGINAAINNGYPYLKWQAASTPAATTLTGGPGLVSIPITVTADGLFKVYGSVDPLLNYHITSGSLSGSDAFSGALTRVSGPNVGTYAINLGTLALPSAYTLTYVGATLTITPVSLTITADNASRQAGVANPTFTVSYSGFVAGDGSSAVSGLTWSTPATTSSPAGTYSIIPGGASALNYTISYVNGLLTVTPATNTTPSVPPPQNQINPTLPTPTVVTPPPVLTTPIGLTVVGVIKQPVWNKKDNPPAGPAGSVRATLTLTTPGGKTVTVQSLSNGSDQGTTSGPEAYQCSALIVRYANQLGIKYSDSTTYSNLKNGKDVAQQLASVSQGKFVFNPNGSVQPPVIGAVLSIGPSGKDTAGHVGIVQAITPDANGDGGFVVTLFDQNVRGGWVQVTFTKQANSFVGSTTQLTGSIATVTGWANPVGL
jgi:filamentous hemagglutinin family protein